MLRIENPFNTFIQSVLSKYKDPPPNEPTTFLLKRSRDPLLHRVREYVRDSAWPPLKDVTLTSDEFRTYHALRRHHVVIGADEDCALFFAKPASERTQHIPLNPHIIPRGARCAVIAEAHNAVTSAHFGFRKTLAALRHRFWWPHVELDVELYCRQCETC